MGLISKQVEIGISGCNYKHYEALGYKIPRRKSRNQMKIISGEKILVDVKDLYPKCGVTVEVQCDCCQKKYPMIYQNYTKQNHNGKIYCAHCAPSIFVSGENSHWYNSELSDEFRNDNRKYIDYYNFIKRVLARDNYTCLCCGKNISGKMQVHHLDGYNWCVEKRTDDTNAITLCETCHANFHALYGKGSNTKEQFEEWIGHTIPTLQKYDMEIVKAKQIYCYEEDRVYNSVKEYCEIHNRKNKINIYRVCNNYSEKYKTLNKQHLFWYHEYLNMTNEEIKARIS